MTAARHFDKYAAVPGHDEIVAMAPAAIYSCQAIPIRRWQLIRSWRT